MSVKLTSKQDLSQFENFFKAVKILDYRQVTYGFYNDKHYSGLNMATLAAIHEQGWNGLPARSFITSSAIMFSKQLNRFQKDLFTYFAAGGKDPTPIFNMLGKAGAKKIQFVIDSGKFPFPTVSDQWAGVKGFKEAMVHYGDLKSAVSFRVTKGKDKGV